MQAYGSNFAFLAILTLLLHRSYHARQIVVAVLVCVWALRLAGYLFTRILIIGKDTRFDDKRENLIKFGAFWLLQFVAVWLIFLPQCLLASQSSDPVHRWNDWVGYALFAIGLLLETVADAEKFRFKRSVPNGRWCCTGSWRWSRHPNYFGEILLWWGLFSVCASVFDSGWRYFSLIGPLFLTLLILFLSGIPLLEQRADARYWTDPQYQDYKNSTSVLIPLPPLLYRPLPRIVKSTVLFDWPLYNHPNEGPKEKTAITHPSSG